MSSHGPEGGFNIDFRLRILSGEVLHERDLVLHIDLDGLEKLLFRNIRLDAGVVAQSSMEVDVSQGSHVIKLPEVRHTWIVARPLDFLTVVVDVSRECWSRVLEDANQCFCVEHDFRFVADQLAY